MEKNKARMALAFISNELGDVMYWFGDDLRNDDSQFADEARSIADAATILLDRVHDLLDMEIEAWNV